MEQADKIIITEGNRPLWQIIIASIFFTLSVLLLCMFFFGFEIFPKKGISYKWDLNIPWIVFGCIAQGLFFSSVRNVLFDLKNRKYKIQFEVGPIRVGGWKALPDIEYVSVFKQPKVDGNFIFETNLWYEKNKHLNIYENLEFEPAYAMGESAARVLKVDLLNATEPNNYKWVDL